MGSDIELVKMSGKGQLVVPQDIREMAGLHPGERFMALPVDDGVLFKKVIIPEVKLDFKSLSGEIEEQFKKRGIKKSDIGDAVKWARRR
jgi:bifunctional DNA-binding transcriptional regulator/antitoxin component of YhaV-PrlF toxin-antitoxin module